MSQKMKQIYQLKVSLEYIKPMIWRRILISSDCSYSELHEAVQESMGWMDLHLYEFTFGDLLSNDFIRIGSQHEYSDEGVLDGNKTKIKDFLTEDSNVCNYFYDFGDDWVHKIKLEKILPVDTSINYPVCLAGKRACPPEDCGGVSGYEDLLAIIADPKHEDYDEMRDWLGGEFDPEEFDVSSVSLNLSHGNKQ